MGPLFVAIFWMIIAGIFASAYALLHFLSKKNSVAAQLKDILLGVILAVSVPFGIMVLLMAVIGLAHFAFGL